MKSTHLAALTFELTATIAGCGVTNNAPMTHDIDDNAPCISSPRAVEAIADMRWQIGTDLSVIREAVTNSPLDEGTPGVEGSHDGSLRVTPPADATHGFSLYVQLPYRFSCHDGDPYDVSTAPYMLCSYKDNIVS